ncbi:MAG: CYTH domain-containing protein [Candidatus Amulumruptor caecigallinarius]|nr:CYTH domain-containing protein [Candidatus Amulumruptor caecigallinarius]
MAKEIEHKYLVKDNSYKTMASTSMHITQGYLQRMPERVVRVRTIDKHGYLTIKGKSVGDTRDEFEYEIPYDDALRMLHMCEAPVLKKTRFIVLFEGNKWEVDEFHGPAAPLVTAEIELSESHRNYNLPPFVGEEVTGNPAYYNSNL